jgi:hypothetical protein
MMSVYDTIMYGCGTGFAVVKYLKKERRDLLAAKMLRVIQAIILESQHQVREERQFTQAD